MAEAVVFDFDAVAFLLVIVAVSCDRTLSPRFFSSASVARILGERGGLSEVEAGEAALRCGAALRRVTAEGLRLVVARVAVRATDLDLALGERDGFVVAMSLQTAPVIVRPVGGLPIRVRRMCERSADAADALGGTRAFRMRCADR